MKANVDIVDVAGYNTITKKLLMINGKPVIVANSSCRIDEMIKYLFGNDNADITDGKIKKILNKYRE